jgi:hypothetical protein
VAPADLPLGFRTVDYYVGERLHNRFPTRSSAEGQAASRAARNRSLQTPDVSGTISASARMLVAVEIASTSSDVLKRFSKARQISRCSTESQSGVFVIDDSGPRSFAGIFSISATSAITASVLEFCKSAAGTDRAQHRGYPSDLRRDRAVSARSGLIESVGFPLSIRCASLSALIRLGEAVDGEGVFS